MRGHLSRLYLCFASVCPLPLPSPSRPQRLDSFLLSSSLSSLHRRILLSKCSPSQPPLVCRATFDSQVPGPSSAFLPPSGPPPQPPGLPSQPSPRPPMPQQPQQRRSPSPPTSSHISKGASPSKRYSLPTLLICRSFIFIFPQTLNQSPSEHPHSSRTKIWTFSSRSSLPRPSLRTKGTWRPSTMTGCKSTGASPS